MPTFTPVDDAFLVNTTTAGDQNEAAIAHLTGGGFVALWADSSVPGQKIARGQRFDADGNRVGDEFAIGSADQFNDKTPDVAALSTGGFVVTWVDYSSGNH